MRVRSFIPLVAMTIGLAACTTDVPANDLELGDCVENGAAFEASEGVSEVPTIDCEEPHQYEVFALVDYPDADEYPGLDAVQTKSGELCTAEVEGYVGAPLERTQFSLQALYPSQDTWDAGDRIIICLLESAEPVEGSAEDSAGGDDTESEA